MKFPISFLFALCLMFGTNAIMAQSSACQPSNSNVELCKKICQDKPDCKPADCLASVAKNQKTEDCAKMVANNFALSKIWPLSLLNAKTNTAKAVSNKEQKTVQCASYQLRSCQPASTFKETVASAEK